MHKDKETIISHVYDVDIIATYYRISALKFTKKDSLSKELYLEDIMSSIKYICETGNKNSEFYVNNKIPLVISSDIYNFENHIGKFLITFDIPKIPAFLSYQKKNYTGQVDFVDFVEFRVYEIVKNFSPINNSVRLEKIIQWVMNERSKVKEQADSDDKVISEKKIKTIEYALYHFYLQEAKIEDPFVRTKKLTKRKMMVNQGVKYGVGGESFANLYYDIYTKADRLCDSYLVKIENVIDMLTDYPDAKKIAEDEIKEIPTWKIKK
jgi:hypothetical protein